MHRVWSSQIGYRPVEHLALLGSQRVDEDARDAQVLVEPVPDDFGQQVAAALALVVQHLELQDVRGAQLLSQRIEVGEPGDTDVDPLVQVRALAPFRLAGCSCATARPATVWSSVPPWSLGARWISSGLRSASLSRPRLARVRPGSGSVSPRSSIASSRPLARRRLHVRGARGQKPLGTGGDAHHGSVGVANKGPSRASVLVLS